MMDNAAARAINGRAIGFVPADDAREHRRPVRRSLAEAVLPVVVKGRVTSVKSRDIRRKLPGGGGDVSRTTVAEVVCVDSGETYFIYPESIVGEWELVTRRRARASRLAGAACC